MTDELKQKAVALRQQGLTYKQISEHLDGALSVDWCKRNLRSVEVVESGAYIKEIIALGVRPQGITEYEATGIVFKHHPDASKDKVRYAKKKARENKECLIHSGWIDHMKPTESHKSMNAYVLHLMDQLDLLVEDYMYSYPNSNKWSVKYEMLKLAFSSKISPEPLSGRLYRNELLAEEMENRLQK